jgi:TolB-like protein/DNA-binding winged helix-turn-helix (wHTH) protein
MNDEIEAPLWIGAWRLDPLTSTLSRGAESTPLDLRALQVLLCLSKQPGRVVTTGELLDQVWPDVTVGQDSVYQAIAGLRRALADNSRQPTYIATVPRKGYRLIAPVSRGPDERAELGWLDQSVVPVDRTAPRNRRTLLAVLTVIALVLLIFFLRFGPALQARTDVTIAVLPFLDMTSESMEQEYVADGVTEELIGRLSAVPGFHVASPTTSFSLKGKELAPEQISQQIGVAYILDGSLREANGKRRVSVRLVRGKDGIVLWTNNYDSTDEDVLKLQDGIASDVAILLTKKLIPVRDNAGS